MKCPFCNPKIIQKQLLLETLTEYVLYNNRKTNKGRCLVVPKRHVSTIRELTKTEVKSLILTVQQVAETLESYLHPAGINYGFNEGAKAGQEIEHFHFHILPRFDADFLPKYHLFHSDHTRMKIYSAEDFQALVKEFRKVFAGKILTTSPTDPS